MRETLREEILIDFYNGNGIPAHPNYCEHYYCCHQCSHNATCGGCTFFFIIIPRPSGSGSSS